MLDLVRDSLINTYRIRHLQWQMTTELWQAVRTSDIMQVKLVLQHLKQVLNGDSVGEALTPRHSSDPLLCLAGRSTSASHETAPATADSVSSVRKSPRTDDSIGSPPNTPKSPQSGLSSSRGRLLATSTLAREVLNAVDDKSFTPLTWAVLLSQEEIITVRLTLDSIVICILANQIL